MKIEDSVKKIESIILDFDSLKLEIEKEGNNFQKKLTHISSLLTRSKSLIFRIAGEKSEYYKSILKIINNCDNDNNDYNRLQGIIGVLKAFKIDLENNSLFSLKEVAYSEVYNDYFSMAEQLINQGKKDPSLILIAFTLESFLRKLCVKHEINTGFTKNDGQHVPKKATLINQLLGNENVYSQTYKQQIASWLLLKNYATSGEFDKYNLEDIKEMKKGVINFIESFSRISSTVKT